MVSFVHPATDEGAAEALAAAQAHYGERRVIDMRVDGYVRNDPTRGAIYRPRLRRANAGGVDAAFRRARARKAGYVAADGGWS